MLNAHECKIHAVVISWSGQASNAKNIAAALAPEVQRLTVIYSNHAGCVEDGDGEWVQVPQDWYFGRKFAECLRLHRDEETLLQIQADAASRDWPSVIEHLRAAMAARPDLGIWAPDIHVSPYPSDVAVLRRTSGATFEVAQTDGIVWALTHSVIDRLARLDFDRNNIGWGIDWAAIGIARVTQRLVLRDTGVCVSHPPSRGYSESDAEPQMERFLDQLAPDEQSEARWCRQIVTARKAQWIGTMRWPLLAQAGAARIIRTPSLRASIADLWIARGCVFVCGAPDLDRMGVVIEANGARYALSPLEGDPISSEVPLMFDLAPNESETYLFEIDGIGDAPTPSFDAARLRVLVKERPLSVPLGPPVTIPAGMEDLQLGAALATRGLSGRLVLRLSGLEGEHHEDIPFYPDQTDTPGGWQKVNMRRIPGASHPRRATLWLECSGIPQSDDRIPSCFLAHPHIIRSTAQPDLVWPTRLKGAYQGPMRWFVANPDPMPVTAGATLVLGDIREEIVQPAAEISACLRGDILVFKVGRVTPAVCVLWLDGLPLFVVDRKKMHDGLEIPRRARGGELVELRDATGGRILWSSAWTSASDRGLRTRIHSFVRAWIGG